ncbi:antibiotic biosynthesis monooxygenase [Rhodococcus sp. NPDC049939]|uniref:antibiotic biosynthesis monooxygenase family protein n=1 Tax=Rhodococcus sp. NPDC049939 TaxID=3155511 RepID=UPI0033F4725C
MAVVKINAIEIPEGAGPELEKRFAASSRSAKDAPGFLGFQLLRPVKGENRYFAVMHWETDEAFAAWRAEPAMQEHVAEKKGRVSTGASLLEFEVVMDFEAANKG